MKDLGTAGWFGGVHVNLVLAESREIIGTWGGAPPRKHDHVAIPDQIDHGVPGIYKVVRVLWRSEPKQHETGHHIVVDVVLKKED